MVIPSGPGCWITNGGITLQSLAFPEGVADAAAAGGGAAEAEDNMVELLDEIRYLRCWYIGFCVRRGERARDDSLIDRFKSAKSCLQNR